MKTEIVRIVEVWRVLLSCNKSLFHIALVACQSKIFNQNERTVILPEQDRVGYLYWVCFLPLGLLELETRILACAKHLSCLYL